MKKAIIVSGYFNPLHKGHLELFQEAKERSDMLMVIVNSDLQRKLKGSKEFMLEEERVLILEELKIVDEVFLSIDKDKSVSNSIEKIYKSYHNLYDFIFANGGDQTIESIPETDVCNRLKIKMIDGLGNKIQSSSWILKSKNEN